MRRPRRARVRSVAPAGPKVDLQGCLAVKTLAAAAPTAAHLSVSVKLAVFAIQCQSRSCFS
eukprot:1047833-Amphidinium_carterae.2